MCAVMINALREKCSTLNTVDHTVVKLPTATNCETEKNTKIIAHFTSALIQVATPQNTAAQIIVQVINVMNLAVFLAWKTIPNIAPPTIVKQIIAPEDHTIITRHTATLIAAMSRSVVMKDATTPLIALLINVQNVIIAVRAILHIALIVKRDYKAIDN